MVLYIIVAGFTFLPHWEMARALGPRRCGLKTLRWAVVVVVVFIYNGADLDGTPSTN